MAILAFDTHKAVKALCNAGFNGDQAEAVVEQINGAVNENVATKADLAQLVHREEFFDELNEAVAKLATKEEVAKLATKEELREAVAKLATKEELEKLELRLLAQLQKQANTYLKYLIVFAAAVVGLSKMLDLLIG